MTYSRPNSDNDAAEPPAEQPGGGTEMLGGASSVSPEEEPVNESLPACSRDAEQIMARVNLHRQKNGKTDIPYSRSLCFVAEAHVADLIAQQPYLESGCSVNSWSNHSPVPGCCYRLDDSNPECMWDKPELLSGYPALGYESVAVHVATPADAFIHWRDEPGHSALMLNSAEWSASPWLAMGAAYVDGHAALWFGEVADPQDLPR